ncbi:MAG: hypothetical protein R3185_01435 [Candidatus Thermoplasmatota archaeon]|nr:hypothetical protein [Candidatus Thermoplasmatota archaeon]
MSLKRSIAGTLAFGITAGLSVVLFVEAGKDLGNLPFLTWIPMLAAVTLTAMTLRNGWPLFLVTAAGALYIATLPLLGESTQFLPLTGAVAVLAAARFSGIGYISQWGARALGVVGLITALVLLSRGAGASQGGWLLLGLLAGLVALGLIPRSNGGS